MRLAKEKTFTKLLLTLGLGFSLANCSSGELPEDSLESSEEQSAEVVEGDPAEDSSFDTEDSSFDDAVGSISTEDEYATEDNVPEDATASEIENNQVAEDMSTLDEMESVSDSLDSTLGSLTEVSDDETSESMASENTNDVSQTYTPESSDSNDSYQAADVQTVSDEEESTQDYSAPSQPTTYDNGNTIDYVIQPSDTLSKIAKAAFGDYSRWQEIANQNGISNPNKILPGDVIKLNQSQVSEQFATAYKNAPVTTVTVQAGDTLSKIAQSQMGDSSSWRTIWQHNKSSIQNPNLIYTGQKITIRQFKLAMAAH